jgi:predicted membrane-bound mannosyltransferase
MVPAALAAQTPRPVNARAAAPQSAAAASARGWITELQQIQSRLQAAHNRVMQDPQVREAQESLFRDVKTAMQRADPGLDALARRVESMQAEAAAAVQRGDRARVQQLNAELVPIQQRFMRAQQTVMRQPGIAQRSTALEQRMHARMLQVEPETDRLLARGRELQGRLMQAGVAPSRPSQN